MDCAAPIIIIGPGRSGTTLLVRMLDSHPQITFFNEPDFLVPKMWQAIWSKDPVGNSFLLNWKILQENNYQRKSKVSEEFKEKIRQREEERIGEITAQFIPKIFDLDESVVHWGFKDIWNGSAAHEYTWDIYDRVFPRAVYVQLLRNPLDFAASCASNANNEFNRDYLVARLKDWVRMIQYSRLRKATGRFIEIAYEHLLADPAHALEPLCRHLRIPWWEGCTAPLTNNFMKSPRRHSQEQEVFQTQVTIPGLYELVTEMGYLEEIQAKGLNILNPRELFRRGDIVVKLQDIYQQQGCCYVSPCAWDQRLHYCRLFEDERPLGPVVDSHQRLREHGGGLYSIWETKDRITIYFSTSDNSDPRLNGRTYTLRSGGQASPQDSLKRKPIRSTHLSPGTVMDKQVCAEPWQNKIIKIDGNLSPCCFSANDQNSGIPLGNTNDQSLEEIWNGLQSPRSCRQKGTKMESLTMPEQMHLNLTNACNLNCIICRPAGYEYKRQWLPRKLIDKLIAEVFPGLKELRLDSSGELFLSKHLPYVLEEATKHHIPMFISSNGTLINKERAEMICNSSVTNLQISLDSPVKATLEYIRQGAKFEKVLKGANNLVIARAKRNDTNLRLDFHAALLRQNLEQLPDLIRLAKTMGIDGVTVAYGYIHQHMNYDWAVFLESLKCDDIIMESTILAKELGIFFNAPLPFTRTSEKTPPTRYCHYLYKSTYIHPSGLVSPCCIGTYEVGDLNKNSFAEIWHGEKYQELRLTYNTQEPVFETCSNCYIIAGWDPNSYKSHFHPHHWEAVKRKMEEKKATVKERYISVPLAEISRAYLRYKQVNNNPTAGDSPLVLKVRVPLGESLAEVIQHYNFPSYSPTSFNEAFTAMLNRGESFNSSFIYDAIIHYRYRQVVEKYLAGPPECTLQVGPGGSLGCEVLFTLWGVKQAFTLDPFPLLAFDLDMFMKTLRGFFEVVRWFNGNGGPVLPAHQTLGNGHFTVGDSVIRHHYPRCFEDTGLADHSIDFLFSHATLEHVRDPQRCIEEAWRVLRPGGLTAHCIDLRDHRNFDQPLAYLQWPPEAWDRLMERHCRGDGSLYQNRWRANEFREAFAGAGFEVLEYRPELQVEKDRLEAELSRFDEKYRDFPLEDLAITTIFIVAQKPSWVGHAAEIAHVRHCG